MILSLEDLKLQITTTLTDAQLQLLLDASEEAILAYLGAVNGTYDDPTAVNELITTSGDLLHLSRRAQSIEEIIELGVTLDPSDYQLRSSGFIVRRLHTGLHPSSWWGWRGRVDVTYTPLSDMATRELAQIGLIKLDIAFNPTTGTIVSQRIGEWSETYSQAKTYDQQRSDILGLLSAEPAGIW